MVGNGLICPNKIEDDPSKMTIENIKYDIVFINSPPNRLNFLCCFQGDTSKKIQANKWFAKLLLFGVQMRNPEENENVNFYM